MDMKAFSSERMKGIERTLIRRINDLADSSCINLGLGEMRFPTPKAILQHLKKSINGWHLGYTPNEGLQELRELVVKDGGLGAGPDQVCITVGAEEALFATLMVLVNPGDEILVPDPGYPAYASIVRMAGGKPRTYPLWPENNFALSSEDVKKNITGKTKAIIINSPNNLSGAVYSSQELKILARFCEGSQILPISDEVYREIYFGEKPDSIANYLPNFVVVNSLSKTFSMTGWRLGWCLAPRELIKHILSIHQLSVMCAPAISQHAAIFALKGFAEREKLENRKELAKRRNVAMRCLDKYTDLEYLKPSGTFYIFVDITKKMAKYGNSLEIALNLLSKEKVVTIPGVAFGEKGEGYLRLTFSAPPEQLEEGIQRIGHFLS